MTATTTTIVRGRDEGEATWFLNSLTTRVAGTAETGGAYAITEQLVTAAANPPLHVQPAEDEAFYVLEGTIEFEVDGHVATATPGTFAFVPRGAAHTYRVVSPTARMLVICSGKATDNLEEFFFAMGEPAATRALPEPTAPDMERLTSLAGRSGIEFVS
jgi:quercetin dioxygenase-like cupin family protein